MITTTARMSLAMAASLLLTTVSRAGEPVYPVRVSQNGRYFIDQKGDPVFWLGTTQWQLFREYSREDARTILEKSKDKGFAFVQVMLMGVGDGSGGKTRPVTGPASKPAPARRGFRSERGGIRVAMRSSVAQDRDVADCRSVRGTIHRDANARTAPFVSLINALAGDDKDIRILLTVRADYFNLLSDIKDDRGQPVEGATERPCLSA